MEERRYTVVAPTTGGMIRIERVRSRPRLQASYAALKGDFRPLALSTDYHNFVNGPLAAHGLVDGPHELLISEDIDSGRSWEIPVLISHLLQLQNRLLALDTPADRGELPDIVWATGSVDPELHPLAADYSVARKCEIAAPLFSEWHEAGRSVHLVVPKGMPPADQEAAEQAASDHGFGLSVVDSFDELASIVGYRASDSPALTSADQPKNTSQPKPTLAPDTWLRPGPLAASIGALVLAAGLTLFALGSGPSNGITGTKTAPEVGGLNEGKTSPIALVRLGGKDRSDCIERIMLTQQMDRTTIPLVRNAFRVEDTQGLCGLRFINQSPGTLNVRLSGDLLTATIRGNDALIQGIALPARETTDLIFSQPAAGLKAVLQLDDVTFPVVITATKGENKCTVISAPSRYSLSLPDWAPRRLQPRTTA